MGNPDIRRILEAADLTIDATGNAGLAELIARAAHDADRPFLTVALYRGGAVARVRRQAVPDDTSILQRPHIDGYPEIPPLDEEPSTSGPRRDASLASTTPRR